MIPTDLATFIGKGKTISYQGGLPAEKTLNGQWKRADMHLKRDGAVIVTLKTYLGNKTRTPYQEDFTHLPSSGAEQ